MSAAGAWWVGVAIAQALPARPDPRRLAIAHWTTDHGLPQNSVSDLVEDERGFLWVATFGGLCRFDGVRFTCFDLASDGLPSTRVTALAAGPGGLWLGVQDHGLVRLSIGQDAAPDALRFVPVPVSPAVDRATPLDLAVDPAGTVWAATDAGLASWSEAEGARVYGPTEGAPFPRAVLPDRDGVRVGGDGGLFRLEAGGLAPIREARSVFGLRADPAGGLWAAEPDRYVLVRDGVPDREVAGAPPRFAAASATDGAGRVWVCDGDLGAAELSPEGLRPLLPGDPRGCRSLLADREGSLWIGTDVAGLLQVRDRAVAQLDRPGGRSVVAEGPSGELLVGGCDGLERWTEARGFEPIALPAGCVRALAPDGGAVLVGAGPRVLRLAGEGPPEVLTTGREDVFALLPEPDGSVLVGRHDGVERLRPDGSTAPVPGLAGLRVNVLRWHGDDLLVGGDDGVVRRSPDGRLERASPETTPGFPRGAVRDLWVDEEAGGVWVGTYGGGLAWLRGGEARTLTVREGLPENVASRLLADGAGRLWVNGNLGVAALDLASLRAVAAGGPPPVRATLLGGVEGNGGTGDAGAVTASGALWFPNLRGLSRVAPDEVGRRADAVPTLAVSFERFTVNGAAVPEGARIDPAPRRDLAATFTAPTFVAPERVRFQHRLVGYDAGWRESQGRSVAYTNLPPGTYALEVRAQDRAGRWSPTAARGFVLAPALGERPGVRLLAVAALGGLAALVLGLRLRDGRLRAERLEAEVERRRRSEAALGEREARYHTVFDGVEDALVLFDGDGRVREANPAGTALLGGATDPGDHLVGPPQAAFRRALAATLAGGGPATGEAELRPPDGSPRVVRWRTSPFPLDGRRGALVALSDLTALRAAEGERREVQDRLQRAQAMEALGQLAGGVAHDFNNLLTVISASAGLLLEGAPLGTLAADILASANRGADLVRRLLVVGRRAPMHPQPVAVGARVADLERVIRASLPDDVTLAVTVDRGAVTTTDPAQLERAILNLVLNARDAMPDGGALAIDVSRQTVTPEAAAGFADPKAQAGAYLVVTVADTGTGIPRELLGRIFDPFFTTKPVGQGSGLGLTVVQGVVHASGGFVDASSEPPGSRFRLFLPLVDTPAPADPRAAQPGRPDFAGRVFLVCDDQPEVLQTTVRILKRWRATVLAARGPEEALRLAADHPGALAALVTDVVMPGMKGPELARRLRLLRPGLPVLLVSGDTRDADPAGDLLLEKPYSAAELAEALREVLGP